MDFILGGVAACGACLFTNPLEVVKTRMQLQGELKSRGTYQVYYRNVFHAFYTIGKVDGLAGLQKGLVPGLFYQFFMNGVRLGSFAIIESAGHIHTNGRVSALKTIAAGAAAGVVGAVMGSPVYLVISLPPPSQWDISINTRVIHREHGILGLWRGSSAAVPRVSVGSATQLSTFSSSKELVIDLQVRKAWRLCRPTRMDFILGGVAACGACLFTNPLEVVKTRMQLQGELKSRGTYQVYYRNVFHAFYTIGKVDGLAGLQKGLVPGLFYQFFMNGVRLGSFAIIESAGHIHTNGRVSALKTIAAGAAAGVVGAVMGSPVYLVSIRLHFMGLKSLTDEF
uniref:Solute carrier family 25 member 35 n=1 Tax=Cyprinodon variegatus TaxID=28743 RepID=A0A3Q2D3N0_CYPVA